MIRISLGFALAPLVGLVVSACSSAPSEPYGSSAGAVTSATTTYLLPVSDDVRLACHATWQTKYCDEGHAQAEADACVSAMLASGAAPSCATSAAGCFEVLTRQTPCAADGPIYPTAASCSAPVERTCAFYSQCLEAASPCGASGYALGYGEKYCSRYDADEGFSAKGVAWRDSVLHCLQVELAAELPKVSSMSCDAITTFAFDSHPRCYTQGPSICFLPPSDVTRVLATIDGKDLLSLRSAKQEASVAATCVGQILGSLFGFGHASQFSSRAPIVNDGERAELEAQLAFWRGIQERSAL